jgi:5-methylcytosine-specific restriction enzyme subunit McrC
MAKRDRYRIYETQYFYIRGSRAESEEDANGIALPRDTFEMLEDFSYEKKMPDPRGMNSFILESEGEGDTRVLRAGGYVGAIVFKDGTQIELLPMLRARDKEGKELSNKRVFLTMLGSIKEVPLTEKSLNTRAA